MFIREQRFPISDGAIVTKLRAGLPTVPAASIGTDLPATRTTRMVTVTDDGGTALGRVQPRRQRVNVWAPTKLDALNLALDAMSICEKDVPTGSPIAATSGFAGPVEVDDDPAIVVGSTTLSHYLFSFVADTKASAV